MRLVEVESLVSGLFSKNEFNKVNNKMYNYVTNDTNDTIDTVSKKSEV